MVEYHSQEKEAWEICNCYYKIYETSTTKADAVALQVGVGVEGVGVEGVGLGCVIGVYIVSLLLWQGSGCVNSFHHHCSSSLIITHHHLPSLIRSFTLSLACHLSLNTHPHQDAFESCIIFLILSPHDNHQHDMCHRLRQLLVKEAETPLVFTFALNPVYLLALTMFTTKVRVINRGWGE